MQSAVLEPITCFGASRLTEESRAERAVRASRAMPGPGIMTPPSILASASKTLMVVAVPMSKIMQGQSNSSMAATAPATRSAPRVDGSFSLIFSPVFIPGPMHKGSVRVRRLTARFIPEVREGTTELMMEPSISPIETP